MKTFKSAAIVLGLFALLAGTTTNVKAQNNNYQSDYNDGNVSLQTFYDELSPYGVWIQDPQYGYVWRPDVDQNDFRPYYTNGRWAMTEYGNTWVSNYEWGWAPFHYGRWVFNTYREWVWMPDTNWGPAWVDWRSGDGYYGWAPMAPSISINLSFGRRYSVPEFCWNFIPQASIYINTFPRYDYGRNNTYFRRTTIINNTYVINNRNYYGGPRAEDIRRATNRDVRVYRLGDSNRPGASRIGGREVSIFRPRSDRNVDNRNAAPRKFEERNAGLDRNRNNQNNRVTRENNTNQRDNNRVDRSGRDNGDVNNRVTRGDNNTPRDNNNRFGQGNRVDRNNTVGTNRVPNVNGNDQQQRAQRDAQAQQQRSQQAQQQRAQRDAQVQQQRSQQDQQQRAQRDAQAQQQRSQQDQQQRAQRDAQAQQQRAQRDAQVQQQRSQQQRPAEQRRSENPPQNNGERGNSGRPGRG